MPTNNATNTSNPVTVAQGGTGVASNTAYAVLCGGTTSTAAVQSIAGVGTSPQFLTSNGASALPTFQTVTIGKLKLIQTQSISSSTATLDFTTGISGTNYFITFSNFQPVTNNSQLLLQVSNDGGGSFAATGYASAVSNWAYNDNTQLGVNGTSTGIILTDGTGNADADKYGNGSFYFYNANVAISGYASGTFAIYRAGSNKYASGFLFGDTGTTTTVNAFRFICSSGNISKITASVYQILES